MTYWREWVSVLVAAGYGLAFVGYHVAVLGLLFLIADGLSNIFHELQSIRIRLGK
jgi:hypothetical protein